MDTEVLVYLFFFIVVAVVQGIGQKKKEAQRREAKPPPGSDVGRTAGTATLPKERPQTRSPSPTREPGKAPARARGADKSSEGMIPGEIWEEILGLARGEPPASTPSGPPPGREDEVQVYRAPGSLEEIPEFEARSLEDTRPRDSSGEVVTPRKPVRRDRSPRDRRPREGVAATAESRSASLTERSPSTPPAGPSAPTTDGSWDVRRPRRGRGRDLFASGSVEELRKAIILKEVLGPPLALRDEEGP